MCAAKAASDGRRIVADNPRVRHDYHVLETLEAGLALVGTEVKSLRSGQATIREAYVRVDDGQATIVGMHIPTYEQGNVFNHDPTRTRTLLLHRREIEGLHVHLTRKGHSVVPLSLYFREGRAKLAIAIAAGKDRGDKRHALKEREAKRSMDRELKAHGR